MLKIGFTNTKAKKMDRKYYVYVAPGHIKYFDDLEEAQKFAKDYDAIVKEV